MATKHTPADIVALIRATRDGSFEMTADEAALMVQLFAAVAVAEVTTSNVVRIGDHDVEYRRQMDATRQNMGAR